MRAATLPPSAADADICAGQQSIYDRCMASYQQARDSFIKELGDRLNTNAGRAVLRAQPTPEEECAMIKAQMWRMGCP